MALRPWSGVVCLPPQEKVQRTAPPRAQPQAKAVDGTGELEKILLRRRGALEATPLAGE